MNKDINLLQILKGLEGIELYSSVWGTVTLFQFYEKFLIVKTKSGALYQYYSDGRYLATSDSECTLFPSKDNRDWNKFTLEHKIKKLIYKLDNIRLYGYSKEINHRFADNILLDIISEYGHPEIKKIFDDIKKCYD